MPGGQHGLVLVRALVQVTHCQLLLVSSHANKMDSELVLWPLLRALIPPMRALPSWPNYTPKAHLLMPSHRGSGFQHMNLGSTQTFIAPVFSWHHGLIITPEDRDLIQTEVCRIHLIRRKMVGRRGNLLAQQQPQSPMESTSPCSDVATVPGATPLWIPGKARSFRSSYSAQDLAQDSYKVPPAPALAFLSNLASSLPTPTPATLVSKATPSASGPCDLLFP